MNISCQVIEDLLPLYHEKLASEDTIALVDEHLAGCPQCRNLLQSMDPPDKSEAEPEHALQRVKQTIEKKRRNTALLTFALVFLTLFTIFSRLNEPIYPGRSDDIVVVSEGADGKIYAAFTDVVTSYSSYDLLVDGKKERYIEVWSSHWDRILRKGPITAEIYSKEDPASVVYLVNPGLTESSNMRPIFGGSTAMGGEGTFILPRLILSMYFQIALIGSVLLTALWFILRKTRAEQPLRILAMLGWSYPLAHLAIKGLTFTSFQANRDFFTILLAGVGVFILLYLAYDRLSHRATS